MATRYIDVPLDETTKATVRVITQHPDDDKLRVALYKVEALWDWCDGQGKKLADMTDAKEAEKACGVLADVQVSRDKSRRELMTLVLSDKHAGDEILSLISKCTATTINAIFNAARGIEPLTLESYQRFLEEQKNAPS